MSKLRSHPTAAESPSRGFPSWLAAGLFLVLGMLFPAASPGLAADAPEFRADRILVKFRADSSARRSTLAHGAQMRRACAGMDGLMVVELRPGDSPREAVARFEASDLVEYAEPDYLVRALAVPSDFRYHDHSLWGLNNTGILDGGPAGVADADIDAPEAWDLRTDASDVIVAVIDTGLRLTHEDLADNLWTNPGEIPGNGIDDDLNGYIDDVHGINALNGGGAPIDDHGHGSHVAGIIGGRGDNAVGVVGVAWRARIMALKSLDSSTAGSVSDAIECIDYARLHGARVINASWGGTAYESLALRDAIDAARAADILFVAASGNSKRDNDLDPLYPASYPLDNIVAVAATDRDDNRAFYSHWGAQTVDLGAPGSAIFSCWNGSDFDYRYTDGTSQAAATVSGACAILRAQFPAETYAQIIARLLANTDPLPSLAGKTVSGGRLNLAKATGAPSSPFDSWRAANFGASASDPSVGTAGADPDKDGHANLLEYAAGADPNFPDPGLFVSPGSVRIGDADHLALTFSRNVDATDVRMIVQVSDDLVVWSDGSAYGRGGDIPANAHTTEIARVGAAPETETVTVRDNAALPSDGRRFMRLKVALP